MAKNQIDKDMAKRAHIKDIFWGFGHVSRGMYNGEGHPQSYSQLAAMQIGYFIEKGAMSWKAGESAANGKDKGCFEVDLDKLPAAIKSFGQQVAGIKGRGDKAGGEKLVRDYVDVSGDKDKKDAGAPAPDRVQLKTVQDTITERMLRAPKASFVYSIRLEP